MEFIVDVQGFQKSNGEFLVKEVAILELHDTSIPTVLLFKPPTPWVNLTVDEKCSAQWLESSFHGIPWSFGRIPFESVEEVLRKHLENSDKIYVKGLQKQKWLQSMIPEVFICNLESIGCPAMKKLTCDQNIICTNHSQISYLNFVCAVRNVTMLKLWMLQNEEKNEENNACNCESSSSSIIVSPSISFYS